jgi:hypothetical protein
MTYRVKKRIKAKKKRPDKKKLNGDGRRQETLDK